MEGDKGGCPVVRRQMEMDTYSCADMAHLLVVVLLLLWTSGLPAEVNNQATDIQCKSTVKTDIVLLVDDSSSISQNLFRDTLGFLSALVRSFDIGPDKFQFGLTKYSDHPKTMWDLNTYKTQQSLLTAIANLHQGGGGTHTGMALDHIYQKSFKPHVGMRAESRKIVVLITDGQSTDDVTSPSRNLKDNDIEIYTVGVEIDPSSPELWLIASEPKEFHVYYVKSFPMIIDGLTMDLCNSSKKSVRLVNGTSLCSGRLEVKFNQSNQQWSSVCEDDFDQQDAEVVCRELGCGAPSVLQGGPYEQGMWTSKFQCEGHESALLNCRSSDSARSTCSPAKAVGLTCSEPVRLVGGASRCAGTLQVKRKAWRPVQSDDWTLKDAAIACRELDCGSAVQIRQGSSSTGLLWVIRSDCVQSGSTLRECSSLDFSHSHLEITCSESVRLVNGTSLCSGRLEVKFNQSNQQWSSVCEADFDQQDAEVVCRELGCGAPSVLQGGLYGEAQMWTSTFQCEGHESALLNCRSSDSARSTCSPAKAAGLTCSEPVRLVGGASRCAGTMQAKQGEWRPVQSDDWTLKDAAIACRELDCGSAFLIRRRKSSMGSVWKTGSDCVQSGSSLRECLSSDSSDFTQEITCSKSVRLVNGTSLCSGRLEVKFNQSNQRWSSVCEADFDQQDAEVVCRELGCGAPSVLQGGLYGEAQAPMWTSTLQCEGRESALLNCRRSDSARSTCSPAKAAGLTCSEPVRLVGGASRCAGTLQVKRKAWRPVQSHDWTLKDAAIACRELDCGSAFLIRQRKSSKESIWKIGSDCVQSGSSLRECLSSGSSDFTQEITCSNLLVQPIISVSSSKHGASEAHQLRDSRVFMGSNFTISCSIKPQYPGGFFQLTFSSSGTTYDYNQPAVNHSANFLIPDADHTHQGNYSCVYHIEMFSHNLSSESCQLFVTVSDPTGPIIRLVVLPLSLLLMIAVIYFIIKATRGQKPGPQETMELSYHKRHVFTADRGPGEDGGIQAAE